MPRSTKTPLQQKEDAKNAFEAFIYKRRLKKAKANIKNKYDVVAPNADTKRRTPKVETQNEDKLLKPLDRLKMINLTRDLQRNCSSYASIMKQIKINTVGDLGKLQFNSDNDDTNQIINSWFNQDFASNCDARGDLHWCEQLKLTLGAVVGEGDIIVAFDDFTDNAEGKLLYWEADQLVAINDADWKKQTEWTEQITKKGKKVTVPMQQSSGVIYDSFGKIHAYIVTNKRGLTQAKLDEVTILPVSVAKLVKNTDRHNQLRGNGVCWSAIADFFDISEMKSKELQSAKLASTFAGTIKKNDVMEEALMRGGINPELLLDSDDDTQPATSENISYDNLDNLTGGLLEHLADGEEFNGIDFDRPNLATKEFYNFVLQSAGSAFGLAKCYTRMEAYNSYTAFRGEMSMSWKTFYGHQKMLERQVCDWVAIKAIQYAVDNNIINVSLPENWQSLISWTWNKMPAIDEVKENTAKSEAIKNAYTDYSQILGPDWKNKLIKSKECLDFAKELGLPLKAFETVSGTIIETNKEDKEDE